MKNLNKNIKEYDKETINKLTKMILSLRQQIALFDKNKRGDKK